MIENGRGEREPIPDARKLHQLARREFPDRPGMTYARAARALRDDVARQILATKPCSLGKSAAEGPNDRLQADLIDFNVNTRGANKYGLIVLDVFSREAVTKALPIRRQRRSWEIIPKLVEEETNYVVSTDQWPGGGAAGPRGAQSEGPLRLERSGSGR